MESGLRYPEYENLYSKKFETKTAPEPGATTQILEDKMSKQKRYYSFFALLTNEKMVAITTLELYHNKDVIEKTFGNL